MLNVCLDFFDSFNRLYTVCIHDAEKVLYLTEENRNGNSCGEADGYGRGYVFYQRTDPANTHYYKQNSCQKGGSDKSAHTLCGDDSRYNGGKGGRRSCYLDSATAKK